MEQNLDLKQEMQQELRGLQQEIAEHSTFRTDVWRRSVKRFTRDLYRRNIVCVVFLALMMGACLSLLSLGGRWPWWLVVPTSVFFGVMIVDNLIVTRGMARPDVYSREGLQSLSESIKASTTMTRWRKWFYRGFGTLVLVAFFIHLWSTDRSEFVPLLIICISSSLFGRLASKRVKRRYDELGEEVDTLLKEV